MKNTVSVIKMTLTNLALYDTFIGMGLSGMCIEQPMKNN